MCSCGKKATPLSRSLADAALLDGAPDLTIEMWGPLLWKHLHVISERIGNNGGNYGDNAARHFSTFVHDLPDMLPCDQCRQHAKQYLLDNPFTCKYKPTVPELQTYCRTYFFMFHQAIRVRKGQPIMITTPEECGAYYATVDLTQAETLKLRDYFQYVYNRREIRNNPSRWIALLMDIKLLSGI